ncbi:hypothetical protein [Novosphingobium sp. 9]|uniref:hypothetical protein n=1 Tax=Novosphingobium sp. 9 TaxID=2025349 RepID=UPI0021B56A99|nr:hypothetical protein [Novosphingobium sp. 9]
MSASTPTGERHLDVVHVSCDFPDPIVAFKTPVIRTLLELTQNDFSHRVYSLNRQSPSALSFGKSVIAGLGKPGLTMRAQPFEWGEAIEYEAPGRGLFLATLMRQVGEELAADLRASGRVPDLLVAHKLSIEGIAVQRAAFLLDRPYALSIQGDTDTKVLAARPDLKRAFAGIFHGAAMVFPFAPWSLRQVEGRLGARSGPCIALPCPTDLDEPLPPLRGRGADHRVPSQESRAQESERYGRGASFARRRRLSCPAWRDRWR